MSAALIFLASALSAPQITPSFARRIQEYYPQWALNENAQTASTVEFTVLPSGVVANCRVLESVGSERLAAEACAEAVGLKLTPAIDGAGVPAFGLLRMGVSLTLSAPGVRRLEPFVATPDVELEVNRLPDGKDQLNLEVALLVSPEGRTSGCEGRTVDDTPPPEAYVRVACEQAKEWRSTILQDAAGTAVPYITNFRARFNRSVAAAGG